MEKNAISVTSLGKRYRIGRPELYMTLRDRISEAFASPAQALAELFGGSAVSTTDHIWALRDISFEVAEGEILGVVGPNGAGKSTLLKILSGITRPTEGRATIRGRAGALLEVGTGFHPELTGIENIFLSGSLLGMTNEEIRGKVDEILDFAGVDEFAETPVKRYSSGMKVRLGFSVAAHLDPEILLIDEVLAVGDASFKKKCVRRIGEEADSGRTILFVSHHMGSVRNLCDRVMYVDQGRLQAIGEPGEIIDQYLSASEADGNPNYAQFSGNDGRVGSGSVRFTDFRAECPDAADGLLRTCQDAVFDIGYRANDDSEIQRLHIAMYLSDQYGSNVIMCSTALTDLRDFNNAPAEGTVRCSISGLPLTPGQYRVRLLLKDEEGMAEDITGAALLQVIDGGMSGLAELPPQRSGSTVVPQDWEIRDSSAKVEAEARTERTGGRSK